MSSKTHKKQPTRFVGPTYDGELIRRILEAQDQKITEWEQGGLSTIISAGGGAPTNASYITVSAEGDLSAERTLAVGTALALTDAGANSTITLSLDQDLIDIAGITRTRGDLIVGGASAWVDLAVGGASTLLKSDGTDPSWGTVNLLSAFHGDTTAASVTRGDVITGQGASPTWKRLATSVTAGTFFRTDGTDPGWSTLVLPNAITSGAVLYGSSANVAASSGALTLNALVLGGGAGGAPTTPVALGSTTTVLHGNAAGAPTFGAVVLTTDVSGILPLANGGTGISAASNTDLFNQIDPLTTQGDLLYHDGTNSTRLAKSVTATRYLANTGTSNNPQWDAVNLGNGVTSTLGVGNGGTGATTLTGLLQGNGTSAITAITNSSTTGQVLRVTGVSTYAWGALNLADSNAVTGDLPYANITPSSAASKLLGRGSAAGAGDWQEITLGTGLSMSGTTISSSGGASVADNTGTIGLTRVNGSASTAMRSDGAPPLSQAIAPSWTGAHTFDGNTNLILPMAFLTNTGSTFDNKYAFRIYDDSTGTFTYFKANDSTVSDVTLSAPAVSGTIVVSGLLTSGRVALTTTGGQMTTSANITWSTDTLTVAKIAAHTVSGNITLADTVNIITNGTTGSIICTSNTQKLGFWGTTPVVQSTGWGSITNVTPDKAYDADATSVAELADVLGTLIAQLVSYGILGS